MNWILLIFLMNGNDGGHVAWTQIEFQNKKLCEIAKKEYLVEHKKIRSAHMYRNSKALCLQVRN
jgi:hypothetical protein